jgi:hypothetical protein
MGMSLREQEERLAEDIVLPLDRAADTEECVASTFASGLGCPTSGLTGCDATPASQAVAHRLRTRQKYAGK